MISQTRGPGSAPLPSREERLPWSFALAATLVLVFVLTSQMYVWVNLWPLTISWRQAVFWSVPQILVWGLLIHGAAWLSRVFPVDGGSPLVRVPTHLGASVLFAAGGLGFLDLSDRILGWSTLMGAPGWLVSRWKLTVVHLHIGIGIYWVVVAVDHARRYRVRAREEELRGTRLEAQLARAELEALRLQLDPHFLFNTLNSVGVLLRRDPALAGEMLQRLGDLLKETLRQGDRQEVPLRTELEHLRSYLEIQELRFRDRLTISLQADPEVLDCRVPFLLTQPLAENAVRHGIARKTGPGRIRVEARRRQERLEILVEDDGPGLPADGPGEGVGLANTRARLETLHGDDHELELETPVEGGTRVRIRIPCRREEGTGPEDGGGGR